MNDFTDLSSNNPGIDLAAYKAAGGTTVALKVSEGAGYVWPQYAALADQAHSLGLTVWHYHFARPGNFARQAMLLKGSARYRAGDRWALDLEDPTFSTTDAHACVGAFAQVFLGGVLYASPAYITEHQVVLPAGWGLWLAEYGPHMDLPAGMPQPVAWQYTDHAGNPVSSGPVDMSHLYAAPAPPAPTTAPEDDMAHLVKSPGSAQVWATNGVVKVPVLHPDALHDGLNAGFYAADPARPGQVKVTTVGQDTLDALPTVTG